MTKILDWRRTEDPRDVIHIAVQALAEGQLVAFPSEGHYVVAASGLRPKAIQTLSSLLAENDSKHDTLRPLPSAALFMRSVDEVIDYSPKASVVSRRLAQRCWPGSVDLLLQDGHEASLIHALPKESQEIVIGSTRRFRVTSPRHESMLQVSRLTAGPLILSIALDRGTMVTEASQIHPAVPLAIDGGTMERTAKPTIVSVDGNQCEIVELGVVSQEQLIQATTFTILIVCTGNTCRSPMAEALLRDKLLKHWQSEGTRREGEAFRVISAGVAAHPGSSASEGAMAAMEERGLSLEQHQSRSISQALLDRSDLILTMTSNHRQAILSRWPHAAHKVFGVASAGSDITDPFGGPVEIYRECANRIDQHLDAWIDKLDQDVFPSWTL